MRHSFFLRFITVIGPLFGAALMGCGSGGSGGMPGYTTGRETNGTGATSPIDNGYPTGSTGYDACPNCGVSGGGLPGGGTSEGGGGTSSSGQGQGGTSSGQGGTSSGQGGTSGGGDCTAACNAIAACPQFMTTASECSKQCGKLTAGCSSCISAAGGDCNKILVCLGSSACEGGSGGTGGSSGTGGTGGTGGTSGGGDCNTYCSQAVTCGLASPAECSTLCSGNVSAACLSCAQAAGTDCTKLQACGSLCTSGGTGGTGGTGGSSGGTNCAALLECCNPTYQAQCQSIAQANNDAQCKAAAGSLCTGGTGGTGGTSGGGGGCAKLGSCCGNLPDPTSQMQCQQLASSGQDATCDQVLASPSFQMYCP